MSINILKLQKTIIGCAMKVHSTLGNGFQEVIYQRALAIEMTKRGLYYEREMNMGIFSMKYILVHAELTFLCKIK